ncbi:MAG: D-arabinono-1,4-lactone oxidase [Actinomycetota bacterium]|nr:D-arabinono-1,4-lactone oxidase [Actinomycetota bacterium]
MVEWTNWSGKLRAEPTRVVPVSNEDGIRAELVDAAASGTTVRVAGTTHSHHPLLPTDGVILDTRPLAGLVSVDTDAQTATFRAGTKIQAAGRPMLDHGLGLRNQGDIDQQALAGAVATGTHGTGPGLGNFSSALVAARLVLVDGSVVDCSAGHETELFEAARLSMGAVGVMSELTLQVREAYRLDEHLWLEPFESVMDRIDELIAATRHFEYFWYPGQERAICKAIEETDEAPRYPLGGEGERLGWSFEVLPNVRVDPHTEMEYSVPAEKGPACVAAIRELLASDFPDVAWPIEYRTVAADDVWISPARGRATVTISIHQAVEKDEEPYYRAAEEIFRSYGGRPHWGKVHYLDTDDLAGDYDRWSDWWRVRDSVDPTGTLLNGRLRELQP